MRLAIPLLSAATVPFSCERSRVGSDDENFPHVDVAHPRNIGGRDEAGSVGMGEGKEKEQGGWEGRNGWGEREHCREREMEGVWMVSNEFDGEERHCKEREVKGS